MAEPSSVERRPALAGLALMIALAILALARPSPSPGPPPPIPRQRCTPWMADCLPGIGPARRAAASAAIRAGQLEALPKPARPAAELWFVADP